MGTLKSRRYIAKMTNMFKIHTERVPEYLLNIVPNKREHMMYLHITLAIKTIRLFLDAD